MSLSFKCPNCSTDISVKFLRVGEAFRCQSCKYRGTVPTDAVQTGEESTALKEAFHRIPKPPPPKIEPTYHGYVLAGRGERFLARLAENVIFVVGYFIVVTPGIVILEDREPHLVVIYTFVMVSLYMLMIISVQAYLLATRSQSLGKLMLGVKIIRFHSGEDAAFLWGFLVREVVNRFIEIIPLYSLIDILFIFSNNRRCVHDHLAGTIVVKLHPEPYPITHSPAPPTNQPWPEDGSHPTH